MAQLILTNSGLSVVNGVYQLNGNRFIKCNDDNCMISIYQKYSCLQGTGAPNIDHPIVISTISIESKFEIIFYVTNGKKQDEWIEIAGLSPSPTVNFKYNDQNDIKPMQDIFHTITTNTQSKCDQFCSHKSHPFQYILSVSQLEMLHELSSKVVDIYYNFEPKEECKPSITKQMINDKVICNKTNPLNIVYKYLSLFFEANRNKTYFIRLSTVSPKDARMYLYEDEDSKSEQEDELKDIRDDIMELEVGIPVQKTCELSAEKCLQLLCHSERIKYEIQLTENLSEKQMSLLLLNWNPTSLATETRCYIFKWKIVAISQYFVDLDNVYGDKIKNVYRDIIEFVNEDIEMNEKRNEKLNGDFVIDLDVKIESNGDVNVNVIELNGLFEADKCLFGMDEFDHLCTKEVESPPFRYIANKETKEFTS